MQEDQIECLAFSASSLVKNTNTANIVCKQRIIEGWHHIKESKFFHLWLNYDFLDLSWMNIFYIHVKYFHFWQTYDFTDLEVRWRMRGKKVRQWGSFCSTMHSSALPSSFPEAVGIPSIHPSFLFLASTPLHYPLSHPNVFPSVRLFCFTPSGFFTGLFREKLFLNDSKAKTKCGLEKPLYK